MDFALGLEATNPSNGSLRNGAMLAASRQWAGPRRSSPWPSGATGRGRRASTLS